MHELSKRSDVIISNAGKRVAAVIQDVKDYVKEAEQQLGNKEYYKMLDSDQQKRIKS